jgi:hypothetical protein
MVTQRAAATTEVGDHLGVLPAIFRVQSSIKRAAQHKPAKTGNRALRPRPQVCVGLGDRREDGVSSAFGGDQLALHASTENTRPD